ncbi:MAG: putative dehydrogenase [Polyangiaceae bacterium]|nr:putative dehydrogenase [Polyangiaceae bacterium]
MTIWNRTPEKARALAPKGVRVAQAPRDAVMGADVVVANLSDYTATEEVLGAPGVSEALRDKALVQLATGSPRQARQLDRWARENGIRYLDGAIMATPSFIGQPHCTLLYSGESPLFEAERALLSALGGNTTHVGADIGHANALDAAILIVLWGTLFGTWHAAALCEAEGFPLDALGSSLGAVMPVLAESVRDSVARIAERRFAGDEQTMATVATCHASVRLLHEISREHGLHLGLPDALENVFERLRGRSGDDVAAVFQAVRRA